MTSCQPGQLFKSKQKLATFPLQPIIVEAPFQQWGLDFIGVFIKNSSNEHKWILTTIEYFTSWVEAIPTKRVTTKVVMELLEERFITQFGLQTKIITENVQAFSSSELSTFCFDYALFYLILLTFIQKEMVSPSRAIKT